MAFVFEALKLLVVAIIFFGCFGAMMYVFMRWADARARSEVTGMKQEALEVMASRSALKRKLKA